MRARAVLLIAVAALAACGTTREQAHQATALDAATTAIGVGGGIATEANPLIGSPLAFAAVLVARVAGVELAHQLRTRPHADPDRPVVGLVGRGHLEPAGADRRAHARGPGSGRHVCRRWWQRTADERAFAEICAAERQANPRLTCTYTTPG